MSKKFIYSNGVRCYCKERKKMDQSKSPTPSDAIIPEPVNEVLPTCPNCGNEIKNIKYLDYGNIRLVFHAEIGCTLGVMKAE